VGRGRRRGLTADARRRGPRRCGEKGMSCCGEKRGAARETCGCGRGGQEGRENNVGGSHVRSDSGTRIAFFCGIFFKSQNCTLCGTEGVCICVWIYVCYICACAHAWCLGLVKRGRANPDRAVKGQKPGKGKS
jgi:hypothetical protein